MLFSNAGSQCASHSVVVVVGVVVVVVVVVLVVVVVVVVVLSQVTGVVGGHLVVFGHSIWHVVTHSHIGGGHGSGRRGHTGHGWHDGGAIGHVT
jgi:hypothetical protein